MVQTPLRSSQVVGLLGQTTGERITHGSSVTHVDDMSGYQPRQVVAVHSAREIVSSRNGRKRAGVVVESYRIV